MIIGDKYQIVGTICSGGMGTVYEAEHTAIGRKVAIKTINSIFLHNVEVVERFHREAQAAGTIDHEHICEVVDVGITQKGEPFLVMPLLKGQSLRHVLKDQHHLDTKRAVDIAKQILMALGAAHKQKIVHRDLKAANIFLTQIGKQTDFVKVLDFGICKILDSNQDTSVTRPGAVLGTPLNMAPEQATGSSDVDHRADIYAIGVLLYEMLTGEHPFKGKSHNEILVKLLTTPFVPPSKLNGFIPKELDQVILKAMARDPADRYKNADEMLSALKTITHRSHQPICVAESATDLDIGPDVITATADWQNETLVAQKKPLFTRKRQALTILAAIILVTSATGLIVSASKHQNPEEIPIDDDQKRTLTIPSQQTIKGNITVIEASSAQTPPPVLAPLSPMVLNPPECADTDPSCQKDATKENKKKKNSQPAKTRHKKSESRKKSKRLLKGKYSSEFVTDYGE